MRVWFPFLLFILNVCFISCAPSDRQETQKKNNNMVIEQAPDVEFPMFNNQHVFIRSSGVHLAHFDTTTSQLYLLSEDMYVSYPDQYFVKDTNYCFYFNHIWIQNSILNGTHTDKIGLKAEHAYANKILTEMLMDQVTLSFQGKDFLLHSSMLHWFQEEGLLLSTPISTHQLDTSDGTQLSGQHLVLNYRSKFFTMDYPTVLVKGDI